MASSRWANCNVACDGDHAYEEPCNVPNPKRGTAPVPDPTVEALSEWRGNRAPGWHHDVGYALQDVIRHHRYDLTRKGDKPDDPGWHVCTCDEWQGYWSGFEPHVADHLRPLAARAAAPDALRVAVEALAAEWEADAEAATRVGLPCPHGCGSCVTHRHLGVLRALLEDGAVDGG